MIDLTGIAVAVLSLLAVWVTTHVVPWIKARTTAEQRRVAKQLVKTAVYAAEQLYKGTGRGGEKLRYVEGRLADAGIKLDVDVITDMIEAAVLELAIKRDWGSVTYEYEDVTPPELDQPIFEVVPEIGDVGVTPGGMRFIVTCVSETEPMEPGYYVLCGDYWIRYVEAVHEPPDDAAG